jgi:hypothetical protein
MTTDFLELTELVQNQAQPHIPLNTATEVEDAAIAGQVNIALVTDADYSILTSGIPAQWQYATIRITDVGTVLTTGRNIIWPNKPRRGSFYFMNGTAESLTVKRSGQTGVTVSAGASALLRDNGTDVEAVASAGVSGYTISNDATDASHSPTALITEYAAKTYAESLVVNLWDDRGTFDASGNVFPSTGGSGTAGAILKGDIWLISVAGTLGGSAVQIGDTVRALVDTPGQTAGNWSILNGNLPFSFTTVGTSFATLTNPSAVTFPRINADNTVTARSAADFADDIGFGTTDTPTLGGLTLSPAADTSALTISGYSVTGSGTTIASSIAGTWNTSGAPTAIDVNITNTASATTSRLLNLRVDSSPVFGVQRTGMTALVSSSTSTTAGGVGSTARIDIRNSSNTANNFSTISYTGNSGNIAATMAAQFTDHTNSVADFNYTVRVNGTLTQAMVLKGAASGGTNGGWLGLGTTSPDRQFHVEVSDAVTNAVTYSSRHSHITSGTAASGFGTGVEYELENASGTNRVAASQEFTWSDATNASEDCTYKLRLMVGGTLTDTVTVTSVGAMTVVGQITQNSGINVGYLEIPQNAQTGNYTAVLADSGKHIFHASGDGAGDTYTIPANASVAYPLGTTLTFVNRDTNTVAIAITSDTMYLGGTTTTGTRTLAENGVATAIKVTSTVWIISGSGLT